MFQQIHLDAGGGNQDNIIDALYFIAYLRLGKKMTTVMKRVLQVLALSGFVRATITAQEPMVYFPDQVGDYWVWRTDSIRGVYNPITNRREIEGVDSIAGAQFFRMHESLISADSSIQSQWFVRMGTDTSGTVMAAYGDTSLVDSATIFDPPLLWTPREGPTGRYVGIRSRCAGREVLFPGGGYGSSIER